MACFIRKVSLLGIALIVLFPNTSVVYAAGAACGNAGHGWLPWPWAEYKGRSFTQRDHCGKTRTMVGTKDHSYWVNGVYLPVASSVCKNKLFNQTMQYPNGGSHTRPNWGTKPGGNWRPSTNTEYTGVRFTQTSDCGVTRTATGTRVPPDSDKDGVGDHIDACLETPAGETVNSSGCAKSQLDTDGDRVSDDKDECPGTRPNVVPDPRGCTHSQIKDNACPNAWQNTEEPIQTNVTSIPWENARDRTLARRHLSRLDVVETIDKGGARVTLDDLVDDPLTVASECMVYRNYAASGIEYSKPKPPSPDVVRKVEYGWIPATF